jgi:hypothetical protein
VVSSVRRPARYGNESVAVAAVHGDEVWRRFDAALLDCLEKFVKPAVCTDYRLEPNRKSRDVAEMIKHVEQVSRRVDFRVAIRADGRLTLRNSSNLRDFRTDLFTRQDTAFARLCALAKLEFDHLDLRIRRDLAQFVVVDVAVLVPGAVFGCA